MAKYRRKPVIVDAEQFFVDKKPWPEGVYQASRSRWTKCTENAKLFIIANANTVIYIENGDWIVTEPDGVYYQVVKPDIFEQTYGVIE